MSVCADQLLLSVADPGQIGALSYLSQEKEISAYAHQADQQLIHHGQLENILPLKPDLVIVDDWTPLATKQMLQRLNVPTLSIKTASELDDLPDIITQLGDALGREDKAAELTRQWNGILQQYHHTQTGQPLAAMFRPNGYSPGLGTVPGAVLMHLGYRNLSTELHMTGSQSLELEQFLYWQPTLWVKDVIPDGNFGNGEMLYRHPALGRTHTEETFVPLAAWFCLTPRTEQAFVKLNGRGSLLAQYE